MYSQSIHESTSISLGLYLSSELLTEHQGAGKGKLFSDGYHTCIPDNRTDFTWPLVIDQEILGTLLAFSMHFLAT